MLATQLVQGRKTMAVNSTMKESIKAISDRLQKRPLILIDTIGSGSSSRPKWDIKNGFDADLFFSKTLESWREAMDLKDFYLIGFSYGGYIAGTYASMYPKNIRKLILCGPLGLAQKP